MRSRQTTMRRPKMMAAMMTQILICAIPSKCLGFANARPFIAGGIRHPSLVASSVMIRFKQGTRSKHRARKPLSTSAEDSQEEGSLASTSTRGSGVGVSQMTQVRDVPQIDEKGSSGSPATRQTSEDRLKKLASRSALAVAVAGLIVYRKPVLAFLNYVRSDWLYATLGRLESAGPVGLLVYGVAFFLWECTLGITTPVETAAGIAFGSTKAILATGTAKFLGAITSFLIGRYYLHDKVEPFVREQELLQLVQASMQETPFRVALLLRFAPLPEFVKNYGIAVLPLPLRTFALTTFLHGIPFTCLWSSLGGETARVMKGASPSKSLKVLMAAAFWIGIGAQMGMAYWIKTLRDKQVEQRSSTSDVDAVHAQTF